jgi:H+/Cl- antiporter ClcA
MRPTILAPQGGRRPRGTGRHGIALRRVDRPRGSHGARGAVIVHGVWRWLPHGRVEVERRALVLAGGAAGVAAAFNTPLAGIVFAIEELSRSFEGRASGTTLAAVILAGVIAIALVGDYTSFGRPVVASELRAFTPSVLVVAIACGLAGGLVSRVTLAASRRLGILQKVRDRHPVLYAAGCGAGVALLGALAGGLTYGTGYEEARYAEPPKRANS